MRSTAENSTSARFCIPVIVERVSAVLLAEKTPCFAVFWVDVCTANVRHEPELVGVVVCTDLINAGMQAIAVCRWTEIVCNR